MWGVGEALILSTPTIFIDTYIHLDMRVREYMSHCGYICWYGVIGEERSKCVESMHARDMMG